MMYECDLKGSPVSCEILEWDTLTGQCLIEYTDRIGLLRLWVDGATIKHRIPEQEISQ